VKDVRSFLGLASFYRRFVPHFADVAKPLTQLTKKYKIWDWSQECQESLDELKNKLSNTHVLAIPDFKVSFILTTDASAAGLGAVLFQVQKGTERPISFASRQLNKAERAYYIRTGDLISCMSNKVLYVLFVWEKNFSENRSYSSEVLTQFFSQQSSYALEPTFFWI
jgi:hypothetical protein